MKQHFPCIILVEPQLAENIGMAARAMKNCAFSELRLVNPRESHLSDKALAASSNSEEILQNALVFNSLEDALADIQIAYATTARKRDQTKMIYDAPQAAQKLNEHINQGIKCALVFGPERTGLRNEDVCLCNAIINIPLNPAHCSLNLSQAVLLTSYEYYKTTLNKNSPYLETNHTNLADKNKIIYLCQHLENQLQDFANFADAAKKDKLVLNLRNIFTRAELTEQEVNTLYGIINYLSSKKSIDF